MKTGSEVRGAASMDNTMLSIGLLKSCWNEQLMSYNCSLFLKLKKKSCTSPEKANQLCAEFDVAFQVVNFQPWIRRIKK